MSELKDYDIMNIEAMDDERLEKSESGRIQVTRVYIKSEADKVIAELKDKCNMHDFFWDGCGFAKRGFKNTIAVSEAFDNLDAENRALKRALWLMTAKWAEAMGLASSNIAVKLSFKERFFYNDEADREKDIKRYRHRQVVFYRYASYCESKAEEYA